jgi:DeoR/GlpR family transcriptional regulator of sugar metabolism
MSARILVVIAYIKQQEAASISEIARALNKYSRNTIKKDLSYLVNEGLLLKTGAGRGVRYHAIE